MKKLNFILILTLVSISVFGQDSLRCLTYGNPPNITTALDEIGYYLNGQIQEYNGCQSAPAIIIALWGPACAPTDNCGHYYGQANVYNPASGSCNIGTAGSGTCRNRREKYFIFRFNDQSQMTGMRQMLNQLPNDTFILAYTWYTYAYSTDTIFTNAFAALGATAITTIPDSVPYIFFGKKGNAGSIIELVGNTMNDTLELNAVFTCGTLGLEDPEINIINVYPNPTSDFIEIEINNAKNYKYSIYDFLGKKLFTPSFIQVDKSELDVTSLQEGIYLLRIENVNGILLTKRITKN